ncbi:Presenilin-domain-containing protein [Fragilariopsis cylindrus CCMP1102]|uniref:Presenilin-domain-containing protein n=1 Tax=Fragilariopsis cylindrus CCMP1102 TaxID=635003 RepID=A0A1E7FFK3_9STRA|nr:Presenilin-domain-containing protein [Fragilariopsis cylindrus CCMP1102]|eukprot:OEU16927.1 Presenilin-domain-containing protein [Fragilariopsis cylindrus CCMP1102]
MVTVIGMMTFVIVLLYKYNCMWLLIGYMMFASTSLLGFLGGHIWYVAIQIYSLPVDKMTYFLVLWNFAAVGILSIFYGKGVPKFVSQGYLICTSVILAWHLSFFDDVMAWSLLFMLAIYDLCAVLTPCGPLKALVNLMSRENAPEMPGLLYEADLPPEALKNSIRLGLGDFIFYSVMVAKAAEYSFTTFAACMLVILAGLGGTLILLSVFHHALPALPISIFLGIFFYIVTRFLIQPWVEAILLTPYYV